MKGRDGAGMGQGRPETGLESTIDRSDISTHSLDALEALKRVTRAQWFGVMYRWSGDGGTK